jgi:lipopolysaccharide transport system ATP-binding protein
MLAVKDLCTRAILLEQGRLTEDGTTDAVIQAYLRKSADVSQTSLGLREDRHGDGRFRFIALTARDVHGRPVHALRTGDPAIFSVRVEKADGVTLRRLNVAMGIDGQFGERITVLSSEAAGGEFEAFPVDADSIDIYIERLPFMPGRYGFTLFGTLDGAVCDWVQNAGFFEVEAGDFYRSGHLIPTGQGHLLVDCRFRAAAYKD